MPVESGVETLAASAVIAVLAAMWLRSKGWGIALPLIALGAIISVLPVGPDAVPEPELFLAVILAPLVFGEALNSSYLDLRKVSKPVLALAVGLVLATTFTVGLAGFAIVGMPVLVALALGAILAPTDAVAVSAVARRANLPRRLVSILEGESLVNDGTGLTLLRVTVIAIAAGIVTVWQVTTVFALAVLMGIAVGAAFGWLIGLLLRKSQDLVAANSLIVVAPFLIYVVAEIVDGSGILAVVVAALWIAHTQNAEPGSTGRVQSSVIWRHLTFILQAVAFFLVGLELPEVLLRLDADEASWVMWLVPTVVVTIIVTRLVFVMGMVGVMRARSGGERTQLTMKAALIVSWAGARGPVSGLAAFSLPLVTEAGEDFPFRDVLLATSFVVIVVTLLLSLTLAPLARALKIPPDKDGETVRRIDAALARAALVRLDTAVEEAEDENEPLPADMVTRLRSELQARIERSGRAAQASRMSHQQFVALGKSLIHAEQEELLRLRDSEGLPDALVRPLLRELDQREQSFS